MLHRAAAVAAGLAAGVATAVLALPVGTAVWMVLQWNHTASGAPLFDAVLAIATAARPERAFDAAATALRSLIVTVCCAPLLIVTLIGETVGWRSLGWSAGATAAMTVLLPAALVASKNEGEQGWLALTQAETLILLCVGASAGFGYWLIAGEARAGRFDAAPRQ